MELLGTEIGIFQIACSRARRKEAFHRQINPTVSITATTTGHVQIVLRGVSHLRLQEWQWWCRQYAEGGNVLANAEAYRLTFKPVRG